MFLKTEIIQEKKMVGMFKNMSFSENKTFDLWRSFMPRRKEITHSISEDLFSVEIYPKDFYRSFSPTAIFEKWACIEVNENNMLPENMHSLVIPKGMYAVFLHQGPASEGPKTYQYIFNTWVPASDFSLDNRPHFAVMGEKYKNNAPDSEEEIWIPIQAKGNE